MIHAGQVQDAQLIMIVLEGIIAALSRFVVEVEGAESENVRVSAGSVGVPAPHPGLKFNIMEINPHLLLLLLLQKLNEKSRKKEEEQQAT